VSTTLKPQLLFFFSKTSGPCRRVEAFLSQVLQRRQNHDTFRLVRVCAEEHPQLVEHFRVAELPTVFVVEQRRVRARVAAPKGRRELEEALQPWLR
jgi:thioredoxin-like negative regulator of GroEL